MNALQERTPQPLVERLDEARADLEGLTADLTKFEEMVRTRTQAEAELRRQVKQGKAKLDQLVEARYRREGAELLLVEHRADIEAAQAEADRLEAEYRRETTLDGMAQYAEEATRQKETFEAVMHEANQALTPLTEKLYGAWRDLLRARRDFLSTGVPLARGFGVNSWPWGMSGEDVQAAEAELTAVLEEVRGRGANLDAARTPWDGRRASMADRSPQDLARPEPYGGLLWRALYLREEAVLMEHRQALEVQDAELPADVVTVR
jgi:DNA repair exonuclease SbcCD ATPase subunit